MGGLGRAVRLADSAPGGEARSTGSRQALQLLLRAGSLVRHSELGEESAHRA